jgi:hypothetical protein
VYRNLRAAIDDGEPLLAPAAEAAHAVRLANAIVRSARLGAEVRVGRSSRRTA